MTIRLIINADDYGRTNGISAGIRKAHLDGVVTSTTCMLNLPPVEADLLQARRECPRLGLGVHLNLTYGNPLSYLMKNSSVVDGKGRFIGLDRMLSQFPRLEMEAVEAEWRAQIVRFVAITGEKPTHLDSHHHLSFLTQDLFALLLRLAGEYKCAIRFPMQNGKVVQGIPEEKMDEMGVFLPNLLRKTSVRHPDEFITTFYDEGIRLEEMLSILDGLTDGTHEIMTHPGFVETGLESSYNHQREQELAVLCDPLLRKAIETRGIQLIHFGEI